VKMTVEFCVNNAAQGTDEVIDKLKEHPQYEVIEYGCLTGCGICYRIPYALVNGEMVEAETADTLYQIIIGLSNNMEIN
jgi:uncharacterized protein YuzB (UPF0349 family)